MPKETKKEMKKGFPLMTTAQSQAYKELVNKEARTLLADSNIKMQNLLQTNPDPNYLSIFKNTSNSKPAPHPLDLLEDNEYTYDPKSKRDRHFDKKKELDTKEAYNAPITANQEYGWREPIDTFPTKFAIKGTFDQGLMATTKTDKKK